MAELMRQIEILDSAVEQWVMVEKSLANISQQITRDTHDVLYSAMEKYRELKEDKIRQEVSSYEQQMRSKVEKEMTELERKIMENYKEKKSSIITDLIHKLHGGI